ncbi:MAG TPA: serine/threonine-protein kinase [Gemmatimonadales bacterium]|nr:serine/threonine-protein kinase [Gemmatimonadales bacterium]
MWRQPPGRAPPGSAPLSRPAPGSAPEPLLAFERTRSAIGDRYRLERIVASSAERVLFQAQDELLKRTVSIRVNFYHDDAARTWFMRESEALGQLDDPGILHIYDAGAAGDLAYRVGNWVDGEGLGDAVRRGPRPIPVVLGLARDLLGALEHAHLRGIIVRNMSPPSIMVSTGGRATVTDLRHCSYCLPSIPAGIRPPAPAFMAPEVREGAPGDPASDIYGVGALLYFAVTGQGPALDPAAVRPPTELRPTCPRVIERIVLRALRSQPESRYFTAAEMLEDFASDAGTYDTAPVSLGTIISEDEDRARWEQRLRRALGDDYELLDLLGTGGFGRVYRVRDLQLERLVALKVLHPALIRDPGVVERFRREAQLAARLDHPNIVNIYEIGGRSGLIWYTMELIDGPSLAQLVAREGPLPLDQVLRILREGLSALAHAHGLGLVHRDIKPENLLLASDGSLQITDFGLALALRQKFGGATSHSGTPQFASPEQLLGERVDQRSDLYSLAAVAYYALLGRPPFPGLTPEQILARQTTDQLPDAIERRVDVSDALREVLDRALRADPEARFGSAAEFLQAVNRAADTGSREPVADWARAAARWLRGSPLD